MQKYKAIIIDDEEDSRSNTKSMLLNYCPEIEVIGEAASGPEGKQKIMDLKPHVVFLDINMPGMNGFQMLEGIYERDFCVIFLTAYSEHGITAVKAGATDYLLKPLMLSELQGAIRKVVQHYESKGGSGNNNGKSESDKNLVLIKVSIKFQIFDLCHGNQSLMCLLNALYFKLFYNYTLSFVNTRVLSTNYFSK